MVLPPEVFYLKQGETLLGLVYVLDEIARPWYRVRFEATPAFDSVADDFALALKVLDYWHVTDGFVEVWESILESGVVLLRGDDGEMIQDFILHIADGKSRMRYVKGYDHDAPRRA